MELEGAEGVTIYWDEHWNWVSRLAVVAFLGVWLYGHILGTIAIIMHPPLLILSVLWAFFGVFAAWLGWYILWPSTPETITLGRDHFRYNPGRGQSRLFWTTRAWQHQTDAFRDYPGFHGFPGLFRGHKIVTVPLDGFNGFSIDSLRERQRILFRIGVNRIEIGACLDEEDRQRLYDFLMQWYSGH